jgi:hypothetical protein
MKRRKKQNKRRKLKTEQRPDHPLIREKESELQMKLLPRKGKIQREAQTITVMVPQTRGTVLSAQAGPLPDMKPEEMISVTPLKAEKKLKETFLRGILRQGADRAPCVTEQLPKNKTLHTKQNAPEILFTFGCIFLSFFLYGT